MQFQERNTVTNYQWPNSFRAEVNDSLLSSSGESDSTLVQKSSLITNEPVNQYRDLVLEDNRGTLVIPKIAELELLLVPIEPIAQIPPSLADQLPLQTTLEDGKLFHTPIWTTEDIIKV